MPNDKDVSDDELITLETADPKVVNVEEEEVMNFFKEIHFNDDLFVAELLETYDKLKGAKKDFIERNYKQFALAALTFCLNTGYNVGHVNTPESEFIKNGSDKIASDYVEKAYKTYMTSVARDADILCEIGNACARYDLKHQLETFPYKECMKRFSTAKEFKDVMLSFFASMGDEFYKVAKKYLDEDRICLNCRLPIEGEQAFLIPFYWLKSAYIFSVFNELNSLTLTGLVHEVGHAIDHETYLFPKRKKKAVISDTMVEFSSIPFEIPLFDFLKKNNIDYTGGLILSNVRTGCLLDNFINNRNVLLDADAEYFKNGYVRTSDRKIVSFRQNLVYGLGYIFGYHLSEVFKSSPKEFAKVYHDINTQRFDISLEEAIKMTGFDVDGFVDLKYISPRFTQESIELKRRFRPE